MKDLIYLAVIGGLVFLWGEIPHSFTVHGDLSTLTKKCRSGEKLRGIEKTRWNFDKDMNLTGVDIKCKTGETHVKKIR